MEGLTFGILRKITENWDQKEFRRIKGGKILLQKTNNGTFQVQIMWISYEFM